MTRLCKCLDKLISRASNIKQKEKILQENSLIDEKN